VATRHQGLARYAEAYGLHCDDRRMWQEQPLGYDRTFKVTGRRSAQRGGNREAQLLGGPVDRRVGPQWTGQPSVHDVLEYRLKTLER
jgi:hypothetical protein